MKIAAIITEYNLFHRGHARLNEMIREKIPDAVIVAVMSENFVQRGEPAVLDKYVRARAAISCGCDLVLSLPFPFCCATAERFSLGGIGVVNSLGAVDYLAFGSESGELGYLEKASENLSRKDFKTALVEKKKSALASPRSHISVLRDAYADFYGSPLPDGANDTLAVEYLGRLSGKITPLAFARTGKETAKDTRRLLYYDPDALASLVPSVALTEYKNARAADRELFASVIMTFFRRADRKSLTAFADCTPEISALICSAAQNAATAEEFFALCSSKKYTSARIRRVMLNCFFSLTDSDFEKPEYTLLLGANKRGTEAAAELRRSSEIPIITRPASYKKLPDTAKNAFECSLSAEAFYSLLVGEPAAATLKKIPYIEL